MKQNSKTLQMGLLNLTVFFLVGCTPSAENKKLPSFQLPEDIVKEFVMLSANADELSDKNQLAQMCEGEMKKAFEDMNVEQFKLYYLNDNLSVQEFKVLSSSKERGQARVVYQVTIENKQGTDVTKEANQREVDLIETPQGWLIQSIRASGTDKISFMKGMIF